MRHELRVIMQRWDQYFRKASLAVCPGWTRETGDCNSELATSLKCIKDFVPAFTAHPRGSFVSASRSTLHFTCSNLHIWGLAFSPTGFLVGTANGRLESLKQEKEASCLSFPLPAQGGILQLISPGCLQLQQATLAFGLPASTRSLCRAPSSGLRRQLHPLWSLWCEAVTSSQPPPTSEWLYPLLLASQFYHHLGNHIKYNKTIIWLPGLYYSFYWKIKSRLHFPTRPYLTQHRNHNTSQMIFIWWCGKYTNKSYIMTDLPLKSRREIGVRILQPKHITNQLTQDNY